MFSTLPTKWGSLGIGRLAKASKMGGKVDFPDLSSVLRRSGDLSEKQFQPPRKANS
jgi:hypothetical protein